jgi:hypothetical protein
MATEVFIVITEDRHGDVEVAPFADKAAAIAHAGQEVEANDRHPELADERDRKLNEAMVTDDWVWFCGYGTEGDMVRVVRRELR